MRTMSDKLQAAIKAFHDLRHGLPEGLTAMKPEGASDQWWKAYSEAAAAANPEAPRGQRGVSVHVKGHDGPATEEVLAQAEGEITIKIYGYVESWTLSDFDYYLTRAGSNPVRVRIASPGGDAGVGLQIYTLIRKRGNVITEADGPIASAASVIFLGGQERLVPKEAASVMVHRSWLFTCMAGNVKAWAELMKKIANVLEVIDDGMAAVLSARTGDDKKKSMAYLDAETYFTPEQCIDNGVATAYCEYADDGETEPSDGDNANESAGCEDEEERMEALPAKRSAETETAPEAQGHLLDAIEDRVKKVMAESKKDDEEMEGKSGGDHGRPDEDSSGKSKKDDEEMKSAEDDDKGGETESDASAGSPETSDQATGERAASETSDHGETAGVQSERAVAHYPSFLREEI